VEALDTYLREQPAGAHRTEAERQRDTLLWAAALTIGSPEAFAQYRDSQPAGQFASEASDRIDDLEWSAAEAGDGPGPFQRYLRAHPNGRHIEAARQRYAAYRAPVPGATYSGSTDAGVVVKLTIDEDGMSVIGLGIGQGAAAPGETGPARSLARTGCYLVNGLNLTLPAAIEGDGRDFRMVQRGSMSLAPGTITIPIEAEAAGTFGDGRVSGTLAVRFPDDRGCDSAPITWSARVVEP
jgi:hypothetical protein